MAQLKVTWDPAEGADLYKVEWFKNGVSLGAPASAYTPSVTKEIATVVGDTVRADVVAVNEDGAALATPSATITVVPKPPASVTNVVLVQL